MNLSTEIRENAVRFSFGATTTKQAMDELIQIIEEISNRFN
jgi:cysteine sulfinate desulfinase/cysteine desulfurase-like protein